MMETGKDQRVSMELRKEIIDTAIRLFETDGLHFTMQKIATEMHIAKKTIYAIFPSKESLLCAMLDEGFAHIQEDKRQIMESDLDLSEKIRKTMIAMPERYSLLDFRRLNDLKEKYPGAYDNLIMHLEADWEPVVKLLEEAEKEGLIRHVPVSVFKAVFTSSIESFLFTDILQKENISYQKGLEELMDILMTGIRKDSYEKNQ